MKRAGYAIWTVLFLVGACRNGANVASTLPGDAGVGVAGAGTGGQGATPVVTGVDPDKVAGELSDDEVDVLCAEVDQRLDESFDAEAVEETVCKGIGLLAGVTGSLFASGFDPNELAADVDAGEGDGLAAVGGIAGVLQDFDVEAAQAACTAAYETCEMSGAAAGASENLECMPPAETCEATVAELEECFTDLLEAANTLRVVLPPCERLAPLALLALLAVPTETPESCAVVEEKCPGQFPTDALSSFGDVAGQLGTLGRSSP